MEGTKSDSVLHYRLAARFIVGDYVRGFQKLAMP
jgi:hypothetical protein